MLASCYHRAMFLALDTSSNQFQCGLAAWPPEASTEVEWLFELNEGVNFQRQHSAILIPTLQEALEAQGTGLTDVGTIAVNCGPGSFTGLRSSLVFAKTVAQFGKGIQLLAFNHLELLVTAYALEEGLSDEPVSIHVALDARQGLAYQACYSLQYGELPYCISRPQLEAVELLSTVADDTLIVASQSLWEQEASELSTRSNTTRLEEEALFTPSAMAWLANKAAPRYEISWQACVPDYIQAPRATLKK